MTPFLCQHWTRRTLRLTVTTVLNLHTPTIAIYYYYYSTNNAFSALTLLVGRQEGHPACKKTSWWWGAGVVICLERGADLNMAQLMPLPLTSLASVKSRLVLPFW